MFGNNSWLVTVAAAAVVLSGCGVESSMPEPSPHEQRQRGIALPDGVAIEPSFAEPVVWALAAAPATVEPGGEVVVEVRASMAADWNLHPVGAATGPSLPTTLELKLPAGVAVVGDWELPEARLLLDRPDAGKVYEGDVAFRRRVQVAADAEAGSIEIGCAVGFQACDATMCRRPETAEFETTIRVTEDIAD